MADILKVKVDKDDPAFEAGYEFVTDNVYSADGQAQGRFPWWHGWAVRAAFWAGVLWERERMKADCEEPSR